MQIEPYRWRLTPSFIAHLWKAVTQQHHGVLKPLLACCVPRDGVVFDVGAHAGQFAKMFAGLAPDVRVYAIEPASYARSILRTAIWARRIANVTVLPVALGADAALVRLVIPVKASGALGFGLSHLGEPEERWRRVASELVAQTTIDRLVETLALDRLDFIKADIEGNEMRMLRGAVRTLQRFRPGLLLELNAAQLARAGDDVAGVFSFLEELGYSGFVMGPNGWLVPVESHGDNDFWFFDADDPFAVMLTAQALRPGSTEKRAGNGPAC